MKSRVSRPMKLALTLTLAVAALWIGGCSGTSDETVTIEKLMSSPETHSMTIHDLTGSPGKVMVISSTSGSNSLDAKLGDIVHWKNDSSVGLTVYFDKTAPLFGVDQIVLAAGEGQSLTIQPDAYFGNPGYVHTVLIEEENSVPGSTIVVCPPFPIPCS